MSDSTLQFLLHSFLLVKSHHTTRLAKEANEAAKREHFQRLPNIVINDVGERKYRIVDIDPTSGKFNIDHDVKRKRLVIKRDPTSEAVSKFIGKSYDTLL